MELPESNERKAEAGFAGAHGSAAWTYCGDALPPPDTDVETKIDDGKGVRNVCPLRRHNNLWWFTDMSMYIYYSPTHWRHLPPNHKLSDERAGDLPSQTERQPAKFAAAHG